MKPEQTHIRSRSALVRDEETGHAYVAGLIWQPLEAGGSRSIGKQVRELANSFNGVFKAELTVAEQTYLGLLQDNADIRIKDVEKNDTYSLAAQLALQFPQGQAIVALELFGAYSDQWALVIVTDGVPVLDTVVDAHKVADTVATYVCSVGMGAPTLLSNSTKLKEFFKVELFELSELQPNEDLKLQPIPKDVLMLAACFSLFVFFIAGAFMANDYWADYKQEKRLAALNNKEDIQQYRQATLAQLPSLGMNASEFLSNVDSLLSYPFVAKGWVLEELSCQKSRCKSVWGSEGGYTKEIIKVLTDHRPVFNERNYKRIAFVFQNQVDITGVPGMQALPKLQELSDYFYEEQQAWSKAGIGYTLNLQGKPWPAGFKKVPPAQKLKRIDIEFKGSLEMVTDLVEQYADYVFWEDVKLSVKANSPTNPLTVTASGAMYAR
ncbi:MAG: type 4b pilus protein PilO2 [Limnobacter sp.]|nr:type 4b pilus protein PilO2 [Limnobacter sp.]